MDINRNVQTSKHTHDSQDSHTAADFINSQLQLEADAREALPYKFDSCTYPLGPLRQLLFACMTCNPPPSSVLESYDAAAVCYACSVSCHGEHTLVELFNKRDFVCDCGTTRMPEEVPCTLRINSTTNTKGSVTKDKAEEKNQYNQNFQNKFCGCCCDYDAQNQKGTMFQCLGLGSANDGGCGEDWWHPACIMGIPLESSSMQSKTDDRSASFLATVADVAPAVVKEKLQDKGKPDGGLLDTLRDVAAAVVADREEHDTSRETTQPDTRINKRIADNLSGTSMERTSSIVAEGPENENKASDEQDTVVDVTCAHVDGQTQDKNMPNPEFYKDDDDLALPPGFPDEDDFEGFICYKCVNANPWIKRYAGTEGFLQPIFHRSIAPPTELAHHWPDRRSLSQQTLSDIINSAPSKKRKVEEEMVMSMNSHRVSKRVKDDLPSQEANHVKQECKYVNLPQPPSGNISLFFRQDFREHFCRCSDCFPTLALHPQLLEEEDTYEPPISESSEAGGSTTGSGSIYDRGTSALQNVDRVRAIEGVMAYNQLKEKLTPFFKEFAQSGKAISAEDIKAHFAKMRGDEEGQKQAGRDAVRE